MASADGHLIKGVCVLPMPDVDLRDPETILPDRFVYSEAAQPQRQIREPSPDDAARIVHTAAGTAVRPTGVGRRVGRQ